jgi:hypothetical protein
MAHSMEAVRHALSKVGGLLRRLFEDAHPEEIRELMKRVQHEPAFLPNMLAQNGVNHSSDGDESDVYLFLRRHYIFVQMMRLRVLVALPLVIPSCMSFSAITPFRRWQAAFHLSVF